MFAFYLRDEIPCVQTKQSKPWTDRQASFIQVTIDKKADILRRGRLKMDKDKAWNNNSGTTTPMLFLNQ